MQQMALINKNNNAAGNSTVQCGSVRMSLTNKIFYDFTQTSVVVNSGHVHHLPG